MNHFQKIALLLILLWALPVFSGFKSASEIEGSWVGQEERTSCVLPSAIKFIAIGTTVTGIEHRVASYYTETCKPVSYDDLVLGEGFLKADTGTIVFPSQGGLKEFQKSDDGQTLTGKMYYNGKVFSTYELEQTK